MTKHNLTPSQQEAKTALKTFLLGNSQEFILGGGPGMGKTFLIKTILEEFNKIKNGYEVLYGRPCPTQKFELAATTHPASEELFKSTGFVVKTLHSILNLVPKKNMLTGKDYLEVNPHKARPNLSQTLLVIDEGSMLITEIYKILSSFYDKTTKVIFIMDADQLILPDPDAEYSLDFLQHIVDNGSYAELTHQKRIKNVEIADLVSDYREVVRGNEDFFYLEEIPDAIECIDSHNELLELIEELYEFPAGANRYLSVSNSAATAFNTLVRAHMDLPEYYVEGESVILNKSLMGILNNGDRGLLIPNYAVVTIESFLGMDEINVGSRTSLKVLKYVIKTATNEKRTIVAIADYSEYRRVLSFCKKRQDWRMVQYLEQEIADLRMYGGISGSTIHKAQGASYNYAILDVGDFNSLYDADFAARALYVATSRVIDKLFLLGQLPARFGGSD